MAQDYFLTHPTHPKYAESLSEALLYSILYVKLIMCIPFSLQYQVMLSLHNRLQSYQTSL